MSPCGGLTHPGCQTCYLLPAQHPHPHPGPRHAEAGQQGAEVVAEAARGQRRVLACVNEISQKLYVDNFTCEDLQQQREAEDDEKEKEHHVAEDGLREVDD